MVPAHAGLFPYTYWVTRWKLSSWQNRLEILRQNALWKMQFPQHKCLPWEKICFAQSETKWKRFLTRKLWLVSHPPVSSGKTLSFEGYCCLSSALTNSALLGGTAQLLEPQRWRQRLAYSFCVWDPGSCINIASGENVNVSTFPNRHLFLKLTALQMIFQRIFIFDGCQYAWNNNIGRQKTWHQSPVFILTLTNETMPTCLLL